ncbi:response regulator transcription factor [Streptomyces sp. NPDC006482]|uniref:winged helix-turn-helix transcriptional regulator n=1 Tax=unclassified Streptomyces TaxID=2593676 RepID=UPI00224F23F0|nr:response regulator transcription factor [Streptomyces sp. NBC_00094]MCX5392147.1 response regulator transcription factor [Streptomyces sp. NBC_00094]
MSSLLLLTNALQPSTEVLPALGLLLHNVRVAPAVGPALVDTPGADVILVDGRRDLPQVRSLCQLLRSTGPGCPLILVVTEGGLAAVTADWGIDDVLLDTAGPAEVEARLRLAMGRQQIVSDDSPMEIRNGDLSVDEATYSAKLKGRVLDLTFKEFELLKYLAQHPGRVFTRAQLLQEVWGYDYFGGTRTVDVHVRRLRAKLGPEHESLIGTVRNVGYRFVTPEKVERAAEEARANETRAQNTRKDTRSEEAARTARVKEADREVTSPEDRNVADATVRPAGR